MDSYKIFIDGKRLQHILKIPPEFVDINLEVTIKPAEPGETIKQKLETIMAKYSNVKSFKEITDPSEWQKGIRSDW